MPPKALFKGHLFALSGKLATPRKDLEDLIRKHGGEISSNVTTAVTYLISTEEDVKAATQKVALAQGRGVPIVQEGFVGACVEAKKLLAHGLFAVAAAAKKRKADPKAAGKGRAKAARGPAPADGEGDAEEAEPAAAAPVKTTDKLEVFPKSGLADKAQVVTEDIAKGFVKATLTWDVELVLNDPAAGMDRFYNLQLLASKEGDEFWSVQHWGKTGMEGRVNVDGPFDTVAEAKKVFRMKYRKKTGNVWGQLGATFVEEAGKYKVLAREAVAEAELEGKPAPAKEEPGTWQYYLHNKVDGKKLAWYDYDKDAGENMEKYWRQFVRDPSLNIRLIQSDYFKYEVDFNDMIQKNIKSGMRRVIRRLKKGERPSDAPPEKIPEPAKPDPKWKSEDSDDDDDDDEEGEGEGEEEEEEEGGGGEAEAEAEEPEAEPKKAEKAAKPAGGRAAPAAAAEAEKAAKPAGGRAAPAAAAEAEKKPTGRAAPEADKAAKPAGGRAAPAAAEASAAAPSKPKREAPKPSEEAAEEETEAKPAKPAGRGAPKAKEADPAEAETLAAEESLVAETLPLRGTKRKP